MTRPRRPIFDVWPALRLRMPLVALLDGVTPVDDARAVCAQLGHPDAELWVKRDDLTAAAYGGNKVRTLEVLFGDAQARGATHIYAAGAYGSNHAVATMLHAEAAGLRSGALMFAQPPSASALENARVTLAYASTPVRAHPSIAALPWLAYRARHEHRARNEHAYVMAPGGATPLGALGYVSAALELAHQVEAGELPAPRRIVVGVGSTCTSAGLLVGLAHAARLGIGFETAPPLLAVQVSPWPATAAWRIARLAQRTSALLAELSGKRDAALSYAEMRAGLEVDEQRIGWGYGAPTADGLEAISIFSTHGLRVDTTYSAKAAASVIARLRVGERGPLLFWATKSSRPLPDAQLPRARVSPLIATWLARCQRLGIEAGDPTKGPPPPPTPSVLMALTPARRAALIWRALSGASPY